MVKAADGKDIIYVKIKGPKNEIEKTLNNMDDIESVGYKDKEGNDIFGFEIASKAGVDIREHLSSKIFKNNWNIYELYRKQASLEDVFRELTK